MGDVHGCVFFVLLQIPSLHHTLAGLYEKSAAIGGLGKPSGEKRRMFLDIVNPSRMEPAQIINTPFESCVWRRTMRLVARLDILNHRQRSMDALQRTDVWVRLLLGADSGG